MLSYNNLKFPFEIINGNFKDVYTEDNGKKPFVTLYFGYRFYNGAYSVITSRKSEVDNYIKRFGATQITRADLTAYFITHEKG